MYTILLSGKQGSGKSTIAELVETKFRAAGYGLIRHRFAAPVYSAHDAVYAVLRPLGILPDTKKDGRLLQLLGTDWGRAIDNDIWVKAARAHVDNLSAHFSGSGVIPAVLLEDTRFKNEFDGFPGSLTVRLECPEDVRRARTTSWREDTKHPSETDLDGYVNAGKFDKVLWTNVDEPSKTADDVLAAFRAKFKLEGAVEG